MNEKNDMTSQPDPGTTHRGEPTPPASRFTTSLLLQRSGITNSILSNLKDLLTVRAPKFAHSSPANSTITLKDENFSRSQVASFALHGGFALLLFVSLVASPPVIKKISESGIKNIFAPPPDYLQKMMLPKDIGGNQGGGGGGERSSIPATFGQLPDISKQQIVAPSAHIFPNSVMLIAPTVEGAQNMRVPIDPIEGWGDPNAKARTPSNGSGCCEGIGDNGEGTGVGPKRGPGAGPGGPNGVGTTAVGPPGHGVRSPTCQFCPRPEYSDEARRVHYQGLVMLNVVVLADGRAGKIEIVSSPGFGLDEKAIEAVRNWRFNPAIGPNGKAVAVSIPIEVQFQLF